MRFLFNHDAEVGAYVRARVPDTLLADGTYTSIGVLNDNLAMIAGIVFFNYRPWDVEIGIAADSPRWCTRTVLGTVFQYCFNSLCVARVSGMQAASNVRAHKLVEGLGFQKEGVVRHGWFGKEDAWLYGMTKDECKWIKERGYGRNSRRKGRGRQQQAA